MVMLRLIVAVWVPGPTVCAALRLKRGSNRQKVRSEAMEHVLDDMIGTNAKRVLANLCGQVPIPQMPGKASKLIDREEDIQQAAQAIKAIAHPLRLKILCVLGDREISVQDIVEQVGTSQSNISQHLALMREKGVLRTRKDANRVFYRVGDPRTIEVIARLRDVFCGF